MFESLCAVATGHVVVPAGMRQIMVLTALLAACGSSQTGPTSIAPADAVAAKPAETAPTGKLPETVEPTHYAVSLEADPAKKRFGGTVQIDIKVSAPTRVIWLHGNGLSVQHAEVVSGETKLRASYTQVNDQGLASLRLPDELAAGAATINIEFDAPFNDALRGLYRVKDGDLFYAFTQFEATDARRAFPCFDEPRFKVPFDFTLSALSTDAVIFNTPEISVTEKGDLKAHRFQTTPPLPTYLIAMAIGKLEVVEGPSITATDVRQTPVPLRGVATQGKGDDLKYALENTGKLLMELENYFGIAYPYAKLDIVAVPDFAAGAMENVGLITFREQYLLLPKDFSVNQERAFAFVMAHELAHQWFGNLVTMPWWDDIWLNEAFATWIEYKVVEKHYPQFHPALSQLSATHRAMQSDSRAAARQIRQPIVDHHDIERAFDGITYSKGAAVLSMLETWLKPDVFKRGIQQYMKTHAEGSATYEDLLAALATASNMDVATPAKTFLFQPGIPLLSASVQCEGNAAISFEQTRYAPVGSNVDVAKASWQVPVCVRYQPTRSKTPKTACGLVSKEQPVISLDNSCDKTAWIFPNADALGYYRFRLPAEWNERLGKAYDSLTAAERLAWSDSLRAGYASADISAEEFFATLPTLASDDDRRIATAPMGRLEFAAMHLVPEDQETAVQGYAKKLYAERARKLGFKATRSDSPEDKLTRAALVEHMALFVEDRSTRAWAARQGRHALGFPNGTLDVTDVSKDLLYVVFAVALQDGGMPMLEHAIKQLRASRDSLVRQALLAAMGEVSTDEQASRVRALVLGDGLKVNEALIPLYGLVSSREQLENTWTWLTANYDKLVQAYGQAAFGGGVVGLGGGFCTPEGAQRVESFFGPKAKQLRGGRATIAQVVEGIQLCVAIRERQSQSAQTFFAK